MVNIKANIESFSCGKCGNKYKSEMEAEDCCKKKEINWNRVKDFELKQIHLDLFKNVCIDWDDCEFGAPAINCKRPYGNSDVFGDIAEIIKLKKKDNWDFDEENWTEEAMDFMRDLHKQTQTALKIILTCQSFKLGWYRREDEYDYDGWKYIGEK